ncbi:MAG: hypothetical protein JOS17DRAFT_117529 [Linnemannia elongata]|nr:MAG: hypothetical protein JOS17DRAFT_117529 [Linnemannia elongata]
MPPFIQVGKKRLFQRCGMNGHIRWVFCSWLITHWSCNRQTYSQTACTFIIVALVYLLTITATAARTTTRETDGGNHPTSTKKIVSLSPCFLIFEMSFCLWLSLYSFTQHQEYYYRIRWERETHSYFVSCHFLLPFVCSLFFSVFQHLPLCVSYCCRPGHP